MNSSRCLHASPRCVIAIYRFVSSEMLNGINIYKKIWDPMKIFSYSSMHKYGIIVLNQPILLSRDVVLPMWKNAQVTICVDGGINEWMEYLNKIADEIYRGNYLEYTPTYITGDFDSILPDKIMKLRNIGVNIIETPDQNNTDYTKALMFLKKECNQKNIHLDAIYVFVESAGRFDHIIGNINTLYKCKKIFDNTMKVIHVASNSLTWLLNPGKHIIKIPEILRKRKSWVGLIPFNAPNNKITTTGLKWNLDNSTLNYGGTISTSNTYDGTPEVTVTTDSDIIWTMGIEPIVEIDNTFH